MPSLTLTFRRAEVRAFWMLATAILAVAVWVAAAAAGVGAPWLWGAAALSLPLPGVVWPLWFELGIRAWNKAARGCASILRAYVLKVCYYLLFGVLSWSGSSLALPRRQDEVSRWISRARYDGPSYDRQTMAMGERWWGGGLLASARKPANGWMISLLPVLLLLWLVRDEEQGSAPSASTYTLY